MFSCPTYQNMRPPKTVKKLIEPVDFQQLRWRVRQVFTPATPVSSLDLFAGRFEQIVKLIECFGEKGKHAVMYGDRGVGKTSLANVLNERIGIETAAKVTCSSNDDFTSVWVRLLTQIPIKYREKALGFKDKEEIAAACLADLIPARNVSVDTVVSIIVQQCDRWLFVLDEYDRLEDARARRYISDVIKGVSDAGSDSTIIIVGVGDDVDQLLVDHPSIERNIAQIRMPTMSEEELSDILKRAWGKLGMRGDVEAITTITKLSQGYPHYTHLLGKFATMSACDQETLTVTKQHAVGCLPECLRDVQQSLLTAYHKATSSTQSGAKFKETLLACALTEPDEFGTFKASDVESVISHLQNKQGRIQAITSHLGAFCSDERANVLIKTGPKGRTRYKFSNPLMRSYIVMRGLSDGMLPKNKTGGLIP